MPLANTARNYGSAARALHWLTALLILTAFPLGLLANRADLTDADAIQRTYTLFSLHKTVGMLALSVGILRIVWSATQPRPLPLHPERRAETFLATATHWTLTLALILVPMSGWLTHAAEPGLAPILGPFPQTLAALSDDPALARTAGAVHWLATKLLAVAILLHVAGAIKHTLIDRDATLARMWTGASVDTPSSRQTVWPPLAAVAIWLATIAAGVATAPAPAGPPKVWPAQSSRAALIRTDTAQVLSDVPATDITLALTADGTDGTLDIFAALDSATDAEADALLQSLPLPILQYTGTVTGRPPTLTASGIADLGGQTSDQSLDLGQSDNRAALSGTLPLPGAPGYELSVQATFLRPPD